MEQIHAKIVNILYRYKKTLGSVESVTGGMFISSIIDIPGASKIINKSLTTYSNK